jgi:hypothetical protein
LSLISSGFQKPRRNVVSQSQPKELIMLKTKTDIKRTRTPDKRLLLLVLLIDGICSLFQPALAEITVLSGNNQQISADDYSANIVFLVTDEVGNPNTNAVVNFTLVNAVGNTMDVGLSKYRDETNNDGHVSASLNSTVIGSYTVTATLATDTTQSATADVAIFAGTPTKLTVSQGQHQTIPAGRNSADILFKLTDAFGHPILHKVIDFTVKKPDNEVTTKGLSTVLAVTDVNGFATIYLNATDIQGTYKIIGSLATDDTIITNATVQVTAPLPEGPSLGFGGAIDKEGKRVETTAIFHGGTAVNGGAFNQEVIVAPDDSVIIRGEIRIDSNHVGKSADIFLLIGYKPLNEQEIVIMLDNEKAVQLWDGVMENLASFEHISILPETRIVEIYEGPFVQKPAQVRIYFGYRLNDGVIVFNAEHSIKIVVF